MKLQILVPQYKETDEVIKPLLDSLEVQQVDKNEFGVIIVNDGSDVHLSDELLNRYSYKIEYHLNSHGGVSATRNAALDYATADYVMFIGHDIEEWADIEGYEGLYKISSYGRVYSYPRCSTNGGFIKSSLSTSGYPITHLSKDGIVKTFQIHRLVAKHFLIYEPGKPEVNHKDECKTNNCVWNLEYCTRAYNQNYGTAIERAVKSHDYKASAIKAAQHHDYDAIGEKRRKNVIQMDKDGNVIRRWRGLRTVSKELGFSPGNVSNACNQKKAFAYGYKWTYEEG